MDGGFNDGHVVACVFVDNLHIFASKDKVDMTTAWATKGAGIGVFVHWKHKVVLALFSSTEGTGNIGSTPAVVITIDKPDFKTSAFVSIVK